MILPANKSVIQIRGSKRQNMGWKRRKICKATIKLAEFTTKTKN